MEKIIIVNLSLDHCGAAVRGNGKSTRLNGESEVLIMEAGAITHSINVQSQKISPQAAEDYHQMKKTRIQSGAKK